MEQLLYDKWETILEHMKEEFSISDAAYRTFIKMLNIYSVQDDNLSIIIDDIKIGNSKSFIEKNYKAFLSVAIEEVTGKCYDLFFVSLSELDSSTNSASVPSQKSNLNPSINSKYTFNNFVVGDNNDYAHAASLRVAEDPGDTYNPLYIYGGSGLGKTHLMHAIANHIQDHDNTKKIVYVTSETFMNEIVDAIQSKNHNSIQAFREKYRNVDVLLIDDIQFIINKDSTQTEFFHTFNTLYEAQKQIIISSDKHPSTMTFLDERLRSRFEMGLTVDVKAPTYETRMAILRKNLSDTNITIDNDILDYIASNIVSNIRDLQGAINKVLSYSDLCNTPITLDSAKEALIDTINPDIKRPITIDYILETIADHFNITVKDIMSSKRNANIAFPRHICFYMCRSLTNSTCEEIGNKIGNRHHSTVLHGVEAINKKIEDKDESTVKLIDVLTKKIDPH